MLRSSSEFLRSELSEIKNAAKQQERAIRDTSHSAEESRREIPRAISRSIENASYDEGQYESRQRDKEYRQNTLIAVAACLTSFFTALAFGAAVIYACITNQTLREMQTQTRNAREAMEIDQRAWVSFSGIRETLAGKEEAAGSELRNTGKTPAKNITVTIDTIIRDGPIKLSSTEADLMERILTESPAWIDPNQPQINYQLTDNQQLADSSKPYLSAAPPKPPQQLLLFLYAPDLAPRSVVGRSIIAPRRFGAGVLSPEQVYPIQAVALSTWYKSQGSGDARSIVVFGRIDYNDVFPNDPRRVTQFCSFREPGSITFSPCPIYNDMN